MSFTIQQFPKPSLKVHNAVRVSFEIKVVVDINRRCKKENYNLSLTYRNLPRHKEKHLDHIALGFPSWGSSEDADGLVKARKSFNLEHSIGYKYFKLLSKSSRCVNNVIKKSE